MKKIRIEDTIKAPLGIAGISLGMGVLGSAFDSPGLSEGGATAGKFISPAINISMGGFVIRQLQDLQNRKKRR